MAKSKVFFTDFRIYDVAADNLQKKLKRLMKRAGFEKLPLERSFTALKLHFGEPGNLAYLRPNYIKTIADYVKERGGKPFLTDCNTLYPGGRKNGLDHLEAAYENGFNPFATGCHVVIGDGIKGIDEVAVPVPNGEYVKEAKIGRAVMDADVIISIAHFKVHECAGIGGCLKNIGMGCGSRAGKMEMHSNSKPTINQEVCIGCGKCAKNCGQNALALNDQKKMEIDYAKCAGCGRCIGRCPTDAIEPAFDIGFDILAKKVAEYSAAVLADRPQFHLNFVLDVSPHCDCHDSNDAPFIPDVGIFASFDPVAVDFAAAEAVNRQPILPGTILDGKKSCGDYFTDIHPGTLWRAGLEHAQKIGLGSMDYELITVK